MNELKTKYSEEEIVEKAEKMIESCKFPAQMKTTYNFIEQIRITRAVNEKYLTYLYVLYEKKAKEMENI